jgi:hypothetical protein
MRNVGCGSKGEKVVFIISEGLFFLLLLLFVVVSQHCPYSENLAPASWLVRVQWKPSVFLF